MLGMVPAELLQSSNEVANRHAASYVQPRSTASYYNREVGWVMRSFAAHSILSDQYEMKIRRSSATHSRQLQQLLQGPDF